MAVYRYEPAMADERHQVLLLSFDGFRWDYLSEKFMRKYRISLPNFAKLKVRGSDAVEC